MLFNLFNNKEKLPEEVLRAKAFYKFLTENYEYTEINDIVINVVRIHAKQIKEDARSVKEVVQNARYNLEEFTDIFERIQNEE
jgi:1-deoxy-D-xylulose 5-phosphate reductoisomerase